MKSQTSTKKVVKFLPPIGTPVRITEDVWFYATPKGFDFVVWSQKFLDQRKCTQFRVTHKKLKPFMESSITKPLKQRKVK